MLKLTHVDWDCAVYVNPQFIVKLLRDGNRTKITLVSGETFVKETPEQIIAKMGPPVVAGVPDGYVLAYTGGVTLP